MIFLKLTREIETKIFPRQASIVATRMEDLTHYQHLLESGMIIKVSGDVVTTNKCVVNILKGKMNFGVIFGECYVVHYDDKLILVGEKIFFPMSDIKCRDMRSNKNDMLAVSWKKEIHLIRIDKYVSILM